MSFYGLEDLDTSPLVYQVDKIIPQVGTGYLWGPSWLSAKTLLSINMGLAVGNGTSFMGRETIRGKVAYMPGEGFGGIGVRVKAQLARHEHENTLAIASVARDQGDEAARAFAASLPPYNARNFKIRDAAFPMHFTQSGRPGPELEQAMNELTRLNTPGPDDDPETFDYLSLIILDTLANYAGELSISNDASASRITKTMNWMAAQLDCFVLALAHPTADGKKMLGAGRFANSADAVIQVTPDEVTAPGALQSITISCLKTKDGTRWPSFGYRVRPCEWSEPVLDDNDQPTGETQHVTSATVELIEEESESVPAPARRAPIPLPEIREPAPARPAKRNGLRHRTGLRAVPDLPEAVPVPASAADHKEGPVPATVPAGAQPLTTLASNAARLRYFAKQILAQDCEECGRPAQAGCYGKQGTMVLGQSLSGELRAHDNRVLAAALASPDPEEFLAKALQALTPVPAVPAVPARPVQARSDRPEPAAPSVLDSRLSWTTVRPDSPAPTLEQIFAGA
jgi:AAA domain-containing protein